MKWSWPIRKVRLGCAAKLLVKKKLWKFLRIRKSCQIVAGLPVWDRPWHRLPFSGPVIFPWRKAGWHGSPWCRFSAWCEAEHDRAGRQHGAPSSPPEALQCHAPHDALSSSIVPMTVNNCPFSVTSWPMLLDASSGKRMRAVSYPSMTTGVR